MDIKSRKTINNYIKTVQNSNYKQLFLNSLLFKKKEDNMKKLTLCLIALLALQSCATMNNQRTTRAHTKKAAPKTANVKTGVYKMDVLQPIITISLMGERPLVGLYLAIASSPRRILRYLLEPN